MKKITILLILLTTYSAQAHSSDPFTTHVISTSTSSFTGQATFTGYLKALDTLTLLPDYQFDLMYIDNIVVSQLNGGSLLLPGDSIVFQFTMNYDTVAVPIYPKEQLVFKDVVTNQGDTLRVEFWVHLFYSPWGELEIFNHRDFKHCGRRWKNAENDTITTRVSIPKYLVPISTWQYPDTSAAEWESIPQYSSFPSLPFDVRQAAVHPDTLKYYSDNYGDSVIIQNSSNPNAFIVGPRYQGKITGRLITRIENDLGLMVDAMPLSGVLVELKESDMDDLYRLQIAETHTDANGEFSLEYDTRQPFEGGSIELYLHITSKNKDYNLKVIEPFFTGWTLPSAGIAEEVTVNIPDQEEGDVGTVPLGDIRINDEAMHVCHWTENAFRYADENNMDVRTVGLNTLTVLINANGSAMAPNSATWLSDLFVVNNLLFNPTIRLDRVDSRHENTIYHEWGHFFMWKIQGRNYISMLSDNPCNNGDDDRNFRTHRNSEEAHLRMAWSEGFADAMQMILDGAYWTEDQEYGYETEPTGIDRTDDDNWDRYENRELFGAINNGLKSEYYLACAIYDLWDGADKGLPEVNLTPGAIVGLPGAAWLHPFNDRWSNPNIDAGNWRDEDDISLSFEDLMKPLKENGGVFGKLKNVYEYYDALTLIFKDDCIARRGIGIAFRENRVLLDINRFENQRITATAVDWRDNNISLSSDHIFERTIFSDQGRGLLCINSTDVVSVFTNPVEEAADHTTNYPNNLWNSGDDLSEDIADDLRLGFNFPNTQSTFNINSGTKTKSSGVVMHTCGDVVWEFGNTIINIGSDNSPNAVIHFNSGSQFNTGTGTAINIANNSTLIIEEGATLRIGPGTQIILDGPNAILEIRGNLVLEDGAVFAPTGGPNGQGFVRFDMGGVYNQTTATSRISLGDNSRMTFEGTGNNKVLEVKDHSLWMDALNNTFTFEILDGLAEMGDGTIINTTGEVLLDGATIDLLSGASQWSGIHTWGKSPEVKNSTINNAMVGLGVNNAVGGFTNNTSISNSYFNNVERGFVNNGRGFTVFNTHFNNVARKGIEALGQINESEFKHSSIDNATEEGIYYTTSTSARLGVRNSLLYHNRTGVKFEGLSLLTMNCTNVLGIPSGGTYGTEISTGHLILNNTGGLGGGNNLFKDNIFNISLLNRAIFRLEDGNNKLSNYQNGGPTQFAIFGSSNFTATNIDASSNRWNDITPGANQPIKGFGNGGPHEDYAILYRPSGGWLGYLDLVDNNPLSASSFNNLLLSCPLLASNSSGGRGLGAGFGNPDGRIFIPGDGNVDVADVIEDVVVLHNTNGEVTLLEIIDRHVEIYTAEGYTFPLTSANEHVISYGMTDMMVTLGQWVTNLEKLEEDAIQLQPFQDVLGVFAHWDNLLATEVGAYDVDLKNKVALHKAQVQVLAGERSQAIAEFADVSMWGDSIYVQDANYWICHLQHQELLSQNIGNVSFMESLPECEYTMQSNVMFKREIERTVSADKLQRVFEYKVYPNPTKGGITVSLKTSETKMLAITLLDIYGKEVKAFGSYNAEGGIIFKVKLTTSELRAGTYFIKLDAGEEVSYEKVMLLD